MKTRANNKIVAVIICMSILLTIFAGDKAGNQYLQLKLDSLKVLAERGKEFVPQ